MLSRRLVLKAAGLALLAANPALGAVRRRVRRGGAAPSSRVVSLYAIHTGERLTAEYFDRGHYQPDALHAIARLLRDHRTDEIHPIDPALLDAVHHVSRAIGARGSVAVVSGYRCEATNEWLRQEGYGVAEHSFHLRGRAVDFFMPGRALHDVQRAALRTMAGGVGYYPASGFVHMDTGPIRTWVGVRT